MSPSAPSPREVVDRFYAAESAYMGAGGASAGASFDDMAATLAPDVVLHQSPDLPFGGEFHGRDGYARWARQMRDAFDALEVRDPRSFTGGEAGGGASTVVIACTLVTRGRATGVVLEQPMVQVVTVRGEEIVEFRPFYWDVPGYVRAVGR